MIDFLKKKRNYSQEFSNAIVGINLVSFAT